MSIILQDTTSAAIPKSFPDLSLLPKFRLQAAANRGRQKETLTRSMLAYQRAIKPLSQTLFRETARKQDQQALYCKQLEELQNALGQAERRLHLLIRSGGNIATAYREKIEILTSIKELKERHAHTVERDRQREQHQRQAIIEYKKQLDECQKLLQQNEQQSVSRPSLSISFDDSDDEDEAKLLGRQITTMERLKREGADSPTDLMLKELRVQEKQVLEGVRDRERLAQILRVEGLSHLQPQLSHCGIENAEDLAGMSAHQLKSLPFTKPEKNLLQSCSRSAREFRGLPPAGSRGGAAALLTSRAYDAVSSHRAAHLEEQDLQLHRRMEDVLRSRSESSLAALLREPRSAASVAIADPDGWTLLHRACVPNLPRDARPRSPVRVFAASSSHMQRGAIALPHSLISSPPKLGGPASPPHPASLLASPASPRSPKVRSPRSSIQGLLHEARGGGAESSAEMEESGALVRLLLAAKAQHDAENKYKRTPLHYAAMEGNFVAALLLLKAGADPEPLDARGMSPAQHCILMRKGEWQRLAEYFQHILDPLPEAHRAPKSPKRKGAPKAGGKGKRK